MGAESRPAVKNLLIFIAGGIILNLLSSQIDASLPSLAKWIVRRAARRMADSARWEEEWLADLDQTPGGLAKFASALQTWTVPFSIAFESWLERRSVTAGQAARKLLAWTLVISAAALVVYGYSFESSRYASYWVLTALLGSVAVGLSERCRRVVRQRYDRLNYPTRIATGGLALPLIASVVIAVLVIPPSRRGNAWGFSDAPATPNAAVKMVAADEPAGLILFEVKSPEDLEALSAVSDVGRGRRKRRENRAVGTDRFSGNAIAPESKPSIIDASGLSVASIEIVPTKPTNLVEALAVSELPAVATPEQPIPSLQTENTLPPPAMPVAPSLSAPPPPTNLRIIGPESSSGPPAGSLGLLGVGR